MQPKRLAVKFFVQGVVPFNLGALVPVFQKWIQQHTVDGLLIDVADYKHVHQGPGVVLIGHEGDYGFDLKAGSPGLRYTRKQIRHTSLVDELGETLRLAENASRKLEVEPGLNGVRFDYSAVEVQFLDRLNVPNSPEGFALVRDDLHEFGRHWYQTDSVSVQASNLDSRRCLTVRISMVAEQVVR